MYANVNTSRHWGHIRSLAHNTVSLSSLYKSVLKELKGVVWYDEGVLTHLSMDTMAAISHTVFSDAVF